MTLGDDVQADFLQAHCGRYTDTTVGESGWAQLNTTRKAGIYSQGAGGDQWMGLSKRKHQGAGRVLVQLTQRDSCLRQVR